LFVAGQVGTWRTPFLSRFDAVGLLYLGLLFLGGAVFAAALPPAQEDPRGRIAFVLGGIGFYVALWPAVEFFLGRAGLLPIDAAVLAALVLPYRRRAREASAPSPGRLP